MSISLEAAWESWSGDSTERLTLRRGKNDCIVVASTILSSGDDKFSARYEIECDSAWRVERFAVEVADSGQTLELTADGTGEWSDSAGPRETLRGAIDIDISATPLTNTLPIRRLRLKRNQSAEISVVYVTLPDLTVALDGQRYTCLVPNKRYRYESIDSDFAREIEVDEHGLVLLYHGLFRRI